MTEYRVRVALRIAGSGDEVDAFTDGLLDLLVPAYADADLGGSLASGEFDVWVTLAAGSPTEAVVRGSAAVRGAAHACRGTSGDTWPDGVREIAVEACEVVAAVV